MLLLAFMVPRVQIPVMCAPDDTPMHFRLEELKSDLAEAVCDERYSTAASLRDELAALESDEEGAVLSANAAFYSALRVKSGDPSILDDIWVDGPLAPQCTRAYPGFEKRIGREAILSLWSEVVADAHLELTSVRCVLLRGGLSAVVSCVEQRHPSSDELSSTNVFEKGIDGRWRVILHQGEPLASTREAAQEDSEEDEQYFDEDVPGATG